MTSTENLKKLAKNDWETAMEPVWKEVKAHYKQQEKEIRDHNKKVRNRRKENALWTSRQQWQRRRLMLNLRGGRHSGDVRWQDWQIL